MILITTLGNKIDSTRNQSKEISSVTLKNSKCTYLTITHRELTSRAMAELGRQSLRVECGLCHQQICSSHQL